MKLIAYLIFPALMLLGAATAASANLFPDGNPQTGEKIFAQYNCNRCHNQIMGGDGKQDLHPY